MVRKPKIEKTGKTINIDKIAKLSAFDKKISPVFFQQPSFSKAIEDIVKPSALDEALKSINAQHSSFSKILANIARPSALDEALKSINAQHSSFSKVLANIVRPSALDEALKSINSQHSSFSKILANIARPSALDEALKSINSQHSSFSKAIAAIATPSTIDNAIRIFSENSNILMTDDTCISEISRVVSNINIEMDSSNIDLNNYDNTTEQFEGVNDSKSFMAIFQGLPPLFQFLFFIVIVHIILPQINSISANLLTPIVESYLDGSDADEKKKIRDIKKLPLSASEIRTDNLRFITGNNVRLREYPSTNSAILDELVLGQVVTILSKEKNWIEVMYTYEQEEVWRGWVFTRYTAKFVK